MLGYDRVLPYLFELIICYHPNSRRYKAEIFTPSLNKLQVNKYVMKQEICVPSSLRYHMFQIMNIIWTTNQETLGFRFSGQGVSDI
jgi:hypothetical protein